MNTDTEYWKEYIGQAAGDCDLKLSAEQLECLADAASNGHEHYGMAFYSPPSGDRMSVTDGDWQAKYKDLVRDFHDYQVRAEKAIRRIARIDDCKAVIINERSDVEVW